MKTITYSLADDEKNSDRYYRDVSELTDKVLAESYSELLPVIGKYINYIMLNGIERVRSKEEYLFDLLCAGVVWRIYHSEALNLKAAEYFLLSRLYKLRRKYKSLKPYADRLRGVLGSVCLTRTSRKFNSPSVPGLKEFTLLLRWMKATGEFREEVKRLEQFKKFLYEIDDVTAENYLASITAFAIYFNIEAARYLGRYTAGVNGYLRNDYKEHIGKEDVIFCGRKVEEYHLNMVGAELMNRAFKNKFDASRRKAVLLPACMRLLPEEKCKAKKLSLDYMCSGCSSNCRINQFRLMGIEKGFEVHIIPHSSDFTGWLKRWAEGRGIGVVGVACPLNLITGGLELKSLNIPAQCVLLDYCGCKNHWDKKGIPTDINAGELIRILERNDKEKFAEAV